MPTYIEFFCFNINPNDPCSPSSLTSHYYRQSDSSQAPHGHLRPSLHLTREHMTLIFISKNIAWVGGTPGKFDQRYAAEAFKPKTCLFKIKIIHFATLFKNKRELVE